VSSKIATPAVSPIEAARKHRLVPVVAIKDADSAAELAATFASGGLPIIEITMRTEAAPAAMSKIAASGARVTLMAGTVTTPEQAKIAVDCGAELIISPGLNTRVVEHCLKYDVAVLPGVCTPTEIEAARNYGLKYLKFFPAEAYGGVKTLKALQDVYSGFGFMPTGGINARNLADYLALPIVLACGGSWMAPADLLAQRKFGDIESLVEQAVATVAALST
jgi:2-dehydro-3-deoxyphosphogluconate aldolase / (4S)-4-hydroxy-2-oxoglutarate aldolase